MGSRFRITEFLERQRLRPADIVNRIEGGITSGNLSQILNGVRAPSLWNLWIVHLAAGISFSDLLDGEVEEQPEVSKSVLTADEREVLDAYNSGRPEELMHIALDIARKQGAVRGKMSLEVRGKVSDGLVRLMPSIVQMVEEDGPENAASFVLGYVQGSGEFLSAPGLYKKDIDKRGTPEKDTRDES